MQLFVTRYQSFSQRFERSPNMMLLLVWALLMVLDLILVRDLSWTIDQLTGKRFWVNFLLSGFVYWALLFNLRGIWATRRVLSLAILGLLFASYFAQTSYFSVYRKFVTAFDFRFFVGDPVMTFQLWWEYAALGRVAFVSAVALLLLFPVLQASRKPGWISRSLSGFFGVAIFFLVTLNWYGTAHFQSAPVAYLGNLIGAVEIEAKRSDLPEKPVLAQKQAAENAPSIVFVIGESLNKSHMGVYGYERDTTPNLSRLAAQGKMVALNNALAIGPRTLCSVPYMMTGLQGIDPHGVIYGVPTIFNYGKSAGYRTGLITAQDFQWRNVDQIFVDQDLDHYQQGTAFSADVSVSIGADDMDVFERGIKPFIDNAAKDNEPYLLVAQMSGSHTPFADQVPQAFKKFLPEENPDSVNAYDNTVLYTDHYLNSIVELARKHNPNSWVFYSSDHGENITGQGGMFHSDFRPDIVRNSLLVFPPEGYLESVAKNTEAPVSQADIFATILELISVEAVLPIDGLSLLHPIDDERVRIVTAYMKTLHNDPRAALVFPDQSMYEIDFERGNVKLSDGKTLIRYEQLDQKYRQLFDQRLNPQG